MARAAFMYHVQTRLPTPSWRHWQWTVPASLKSPSLSTSRRRRPHQPARADTKVISKKGSPLVPALCLLAWTSPQRGEAGGGRCRRLVTGGGEVTAHAVPPSNLPPLGGGNGHAG